MPGPFSRRAEANPREGELNRLLKGCGYQGYEFGARNSPDSICCGGYLVEIEDCDGESESGCGLEKIPCPVCREEESIGYWVEQLIIAGDDPKSAIETARNLVASSRKACAKTSRFDPGKQELSV